jgi:hypothetical protein
MEEEAGAPKTIVSRLIAMSFSSHFSESLKRCVFLAAL